MKNLKNYLILGLIAASFSCFSQAEEKEFNDLVVALEEAIMARNFSAAQDQLTALMPLMKKDIKETKKHLAKAHKEKDESSETVLTAQLQHKEELLASISSLVNTSTAALRVKADDVLLSVKSFVVMNN